MDRDTTDGSSGDILLIFLFAKNSGDILLTQLSRVPGTPYLSFFLGNSQKFRGHLTYLSFWVQVFEV